ncbi:MAG: acyl-CoA thioesterase [Chloroflexi bacterium]|nr:acyl-CoA thioesterase [Chloroflexota bacterium]
MPVDWAGARWSTRVARDGVERAMIEIRLRVAGYDIDAAAIVNNAVYVRWLEDLRTIWMTRFLSFEACVARGISPVLTRIEIDYRRALRFGDPVVGRAWVTGLTRATATFESEIAPPEGDGPYARALQTVAFVDIARNRPIRIPEEFLVPVPPA